MKAVRVFLWLFALPLLLVGVKYWQWEQTRHVDENGYGYSVPLGQSGYARALATLYGPARLAVQPLVDRLGFGGLVADFAADLVTVGLQHLALLLGFLAWRARRRTRPMASAAHRDKP